MDAAKVRQINEGKIVKFDFDGPDIVGTTPEIKRQVVVNVISAIVRASYPQGQDRRDGRIWASWQTVLLDADEMIAEVTVGLTDWLLKIAENETLKIDPGLAQAREALADYLDRIKTAKEAERDA